MNIPKLIISFAHTFREDTDKIFTLLFGRFGQALHRPENDKKEVERKTSCKAKSFSFLC